ncbi:MAG: MFS transporter [Deltaproteobacteria bacterium]|jgi:EmrB/QacA subfamily drug resistance transporter|nr:MFS transporter [Deltaproteobacteria bacterium]MBW2537005.1 MFS transporter [Deltaproteobacteria bacterium]
MRRTWITVGLLVGTFLASIEATVVGTAMPSIADQLGGFHLFPWVFSAYLLAQTISIPLYGRLADLLGRRVTYVAGVSLFLMASVACGLAPSMELLVAARALQGLGAGCVLPLTMTIFGDLYEVQLRTKLQGWFSLVWGVSSVVGPLAGGAIVHAWSWRWVFLSNLPFGLVALTLVGVLLREPARARREHRLDVAGAALLSTATMLLLVALLPAEQRPLALPVAVWLGFAAATVAAFLLVERRHPEPLVPLDLFRDRVHVAVNSAGVLLGVVLFGIVGYAPLYVQGVRGGTPVEAGAMLIPLSLGWSAASIVAGRLVRRVGFQFLVRLGSGLIATGAALARIGLWRDVPLLGLLGLTAYGVGMGCCISSFTVSVQERVPHARRGIATALTQFSRTIGGSIGVALLGALLLSIAGQDPTAGGDLASITPTLRSQLAHGLSAVFSVMAAAAIAAGVIGTVLFPRVEQGMSAPHRTP